MALAGARVVAARRVGGHAPHRHGPPLALRGPALAGVGLAVASLCAGAPRRGRGARRAARAPPPLGDGGRRSLRFAAPLTSSDLFHYLVTGRLQALGLNPFAVPLGDVDAGVLTAPSPPRAGSATPPRTVCSRTWPPRAAAEAGRLRSDRRRGAAVAFKLMMAACAAAFTALAARWLRAHRPEKEGARTLALVAFCPPIAWEITAQAHNDGILLVALAIFVAAALDGRDLNTATLAIAAGTGTPRSPSRRSSPSTSSSSPPPAGPPRPPPRPRGGARCGAHAPSSAACTARPDARGDPRRLPVALAGRLLLQRARARRPGRPGAGRQGELRPLPRRLRGRLRARPPARAAPEMLRGSSCSRGTRRSPPSSPGTSAGSSRSRSSRRTRAGGGSSACTACPDGAPVGGADRSVHDQRR